MRILPLQKKIISSAFLLIVSLNSGAQETQTTVKQDPRIEQLLNQKRRINNIINLSDGFRIQIYTGENDNSKKELNDFRKENKNTEATIVFNTPIYKVWVGNYKTRIEAENKLATLKKKYPNAFLVKPNK